MAPIALRTLPSPKSRTTTPSVIVVSEAAALLRSSPTAILPPLDSMPYSSTIRLRNGNIRKFNEKQKVSNASPKLKVLSKRKPKLDRRDVGKSREITGQSSSRLSVAQTRAGSRKGTRGNTHSQVGRGSLKSIRGNLSDGNKGSFQGKLTTISTKPPATHLRRPQSLEQSQKYLAETSSLSSNSLTTTSLLSKTTRQFASHERSPEQVHKGIHRGPATMAHPGAIDTQNRQALSKKKKRPPENRRWWDLCHVFSNGNSRTSLSRGNNRNTGLTSVTSSSEDTTTCSRMSIILMHFLLMQALVLYLVVGAFVFMAAEREAPAWRDRRWQIRQDLIGFVEKTTLDALIIDSQESILELIFNGPYMKQALKALQAGATMNGVRPSLPTDGDLDDITTKNIDQWKAKVGRGVLHYETLVARDAAGLANLEAGKSPTSSEWSSTPNSTLPWTFWPTLLHCFGLVTTIGGNMRAETAGGGVATVLYCLLGVPLYLVFVGVWTIHFSRMFTSVASLVARRKVFVIESRPGSMTGNVASPFCSDKTKPAITTSFLVISLTIFTMYVLAVGAILSGGMDYSSSLANLFLALATVRPPDPLPMNGIEIVAFMVAATVGHILLVTTAVGIIDVAAPIWHRIQGVGCKNTK